MSRVHITVATIAIALFFIAPDLGSSLAYAADNPPVTLSVQNATPRQVEDATQKAVIRDYGAAWQTLNQALDQNRADLLAANFIGTAHDKLAETIQAQSKSGMHRRYVDNGHKVEAIFYSTEGSALELHDTVQLRMELLDGGKVVHSEDVTVHYVALLTPAENSWKVRVLQEVPSF